MEKLNQEIANQIFEDAALMSGEFNTVKYGPSETEVQIYKNVSISDMERIVELVLGVAFEDDKYSFVKRESVIAMCIIKYLTNIPMPTFKLEDGEEKDDYLTAYQIVFGDNGLYDRRKPSYWIINKIENYVDRALELKREEHSPLGRICNKTMMLAAELNAAVENALSEGALDGLSETLSSYASLVEATNTAKN